jgi:hypothetical protein
MTSTTSQAKLNRLGTTMRNLLISSSYEEKLVCERNCSSMDPDLAFYNMTATNFAVVWPTAFMP